MSCFQMFARQIQLQFCIAIFFTTSCLHGQQIHVSGPSSSVGSSFHENFGGSFGFSLGGGASASGSRVVGLLPGGQTSSNIQFSQNNSVTPAFGGFDPNSGARFGFSRRSGNGSGFSLGFNLSQGSTRSINSVTPSITIPNGGFGALTAGRFRPFVTGVVPVVGADNAVTRAVASGQLRPTEANRENRKTNPDSKNRSNPKFSSATIGDASVAAIKAERSKAEKMRLADYELAIRTAHEAEANKDFVNVRRNIRRALKLTSDPQQSRELRLWMKEYRNKH